MMPFYSDERGKMEKARNPKRINNLSERKFFNKLSACLFLFFFVCVPFFLFAEDVRITSTFDKRTAQVGEEIHLTIRISGAMGNIPAPRLPAFKGFDTFYTGRASHISFINGQASSNVEFSYSLIPKQSGTHTLESIQMTINGRTFATDPILIEVTPGGTSSKPSYTSQNAPFNPNMPLAAQKTQTSSQAAGSGAPIAQEPPPSFVPEDDNIFMRAWVDKTTAYPNEQILLTYSLYTRYDTKPEQFEKEAKVSGFWIEEFPMDKEWRRETVHINGKNYMKVDIKMTALFPTAPADYTIEPAVLKASIRKETQTDNMFDDFFNDSFFSGGGFFSRRETRLLKPPPIEIKVKPLPEQGKPASFQGAVGNFRMTAILDKTAVKQNEPVTMKLSVEGEGNIETLGKPKIPEIKDFKIYESDTSSQLFKNGNVIGGRKVFEVVFIPVKSGAMKIPKFDFSFFNPSQAQYVTLWTPEFNLQVEPSDQTFELPKNLSQNQQLKKGVEVEGQDIRYLWERLEDNPAARFYPWSIRLLGAGNIVFVIALGAGLFHRRQEMIYAKDTALKRRTFARSKAETSMRKLRKNDAHYFEEAEKILRQYVTDRFNFSTHGITRYELEDHLSQILGSDDPLVQDIRQFYDVVDESRFGKGNVPIELKERAMTILKDTVSRMERKRK